MPRSFEEQNAAKAEFLATVNQALGNFMAIGDDAENPRGLVENALAQGRLPVIAINNNLHRMGPRSAKQWAICLEAVAATEGASIHGEQHTHFKDVVKAMAGMLRAANYANRLETTYHSKGQSTRNRLVLDSTSEFTGQRILPIHLGLALQLQPYSLTERVNVLRDLETFGSTALAVLTGVTAGLAPARIIDHAKLKGIDSTSRPQTRAVAEIANLLFVAGFPERRLALHQQAVSIAQQRAEDWGQAGVGDYGSFAFNYSLRAVFASFTSALLIELYRTLGRTELTAEEQTWFVEVLEANGWISNEFVSMINAVPITAFELVKFKTGENVFGSKERLIKALGDLGVAPES